LTGGLKFGTQALTSGVGAGKFLFKGEQKQAIRETAFVQEELGRVSNVDAAYLDERFA
jgi:hypothetical protein